MSFIRDSFSLWLLFCLVLTPFPFAGYALSVVVGWALNTDIVITN